MLDIRLLRENPEAVERGLRDRGGADLVRETVARDAERRRLIAEVETLKAERNRASEAIGQAKRRGENPEAVMAQMREVGDRIKDARRLGQAGRHGGRGPAAPAPQPAASLRARPAPPKTRTSRRAGGASRAASASSPKSHDVLGEALGILDFARAVKLAKSRFTVMWGAAARLERALTQFMLDLHTREHGYTEVWVPQLVSGEHHAAHRPAPEVRGAASSRRRRPTRTGSLYLIPTAEVPLTALHADEILAREPRCRAATSPSRRATGARPAPTART